MTERFMRLDYVIKSANDFNELLSNIEEWSLTTPAGGNSSDINIFCPSSLRPLPAKGPLNPSLFSYPCARRDPGDDFLNAQHIYLKHFFIIQELQSEWSGTKEDFWRFGRSAKRMIFCWLIHISRNSFFGSADVILINQIFDLIIIRTPMKIQIEHLLAFITFVTLASAIYLPLAPKRPRCMMVYTIGEVESVKIHMNLP